MTVPQVSFIVSAYGFILLHVLNLNLSTGIVHRNGLLPLVEVLDWPLPLLQPLLFLAIQVVILEHLVLTNV